MVTGTEWVVQELDYMWILDMIHIVQNAASCLGDDVLVVLRKSRLVLLQSSGDFVAVSFKAVGWDKTQLERLALMVANKNRNVQIDTIK